MRYDQAADWVATRAVIEQGKLLRKPAGRTRRRIRA